MKQDNYIPIIDDWYLGTDGMSFLLLKLRVITDASKAKAHNIGKDTYITLGYYPTLDAVAGGLHRYMSMEVLASGCASTLEEYIEKLKEVQRTLDSVKEDLDRAIDRMQRRIETGYEHLERDSRLAALAGREYVKLADSSIYEAATAKIEY